MKTFIWLIFLVSFFSNSYGGRVPLTLINLFKGVDTAHIIFSQKTFLPIAGNDVTLYRGEILYKKPLRFLWRYTWGSKMEIVSDGKVIETVFGDGSCQVAPIQADFNLFPLLLLAESPRSFLKDFDVVRDEKRGTSEVIVCRARGKNPFFRKIIFFLEGERLKSLKTVQFDGTEETFVIEKIELNVPVEESVFKPKKCKEQTGWQERNRGNVNNSSE